MSTKAHPVALTAAMLTQRSDMITHPSNDWTDWVPAHIHTTASLASALHRLAKACQRQAVAECNGEWINGQRDFWTRHDNRDALAEMDASIAKAGDRLDRKLAKLNAQLAPLALEARRNGDPRGTVLRLYSTDAGKPVPRNGWDDESWGVM